MQQGLLKYEIMVVIVFVSVRASHGEIIVLCYVYHTGNMARSTTTD